ncbi:TetR/AcrR family transcriptional regulator [Dactylosporangium sp. NPDC051484]|uniref:TetR/AcrR family transcriptional regulator n=1 Tax=Dactylosporangium sp. NPDC051484 TaxID=3154942 RepID=UPI0034507066
MREPVGTVRPGGRTARTRAAVAEALQAELLEVGYAGTTIERIAQRAGVAKTTVYRRWGSLTKLVIDVFSDTAGTRIPLPDTGTFEGDLRALGQASITLLCTPHLRAIVDVVVREAIHDPAARAALTGFFASRIAIGSALVDRAVNRGEAAPGTDAAEVIRLVGAPYYARAYITGEEIDPAVADRTAAMIALAAREGILVSAPEDQSASR